MDLDQEKENYKKELERVIANGCETLAMLQYNGKIKGMLVLVVDHNHVFRMIQCYGSDSALAMNAAIDIAKNDLVTMMKRNINQAPQVD